MVNTGLNKVGQLTGACAAGVRPYMHVLMQVEGVGIGAQAAAAKHGTFDLKELAKWQAGTPVPFGFIAQTFEAVACESKRLIITQLLVSSVSSIR